MSGGAPGPGVVTGSVRIFDTTLRDGEQAPGAGLTAAEKLEVARQLVRLNVDVIEAGFPAASTRRLRGRPTDRPRDPGIGRRRPRPLPRRRPAAGGRGDRRRRAAAPPRLHRHERHPPDPQAPDVSRAGARRCRQVGRLRPRAARPGRGDRVLGRGRVADRPGVPPPGLRGGRRGRRLHGQHPRHRRLRDPRRVRRARPPRRRAGRSRRHGQRPLPQRPWPRDREHARGGAGRRAPGGGHDQRPRGAGRQRLARGGRDGPPDAAHAVPGARFAGPDRADHGRLAARVVPDRVRGPAEQGDRRRQRLRPRIGDPPGRRDQEPADLRDHDPPVGRALPAAS